MGPEQTSISLFSSSAISSISFFFWDNKPISDTYSCKLMRKYYEHCKNRILIHSSPYFGVKFSFREIRRILLIKLRNFKLWEIPKSLNSWFPERWYFFKYWQQWIEKILSRTFFSVSERYRWAVVDWIQMQHESNHWSEKKSVQSLTEYRPFVFDFFKLIILSMSLRTWHEVNIIRDLLTRKGYVYQPFSCLGFQMHRIWQSTRVSYTHI